MNTLNEYDRKLVETLKSLSLETMTDPPKPRRKVILWIIGVLTAAVVPAAVILISPNSAIDIKTALFGALEPATTVRSIPLEEDRIESGKSPADANPSPPAAREITGSGYLVAPQSTSVYARYQGEITSIAIDLGDRVQSGQPLVILKDPSATLALEQVRATKVSADLVLAAREISLAQTAAALHRVDTLVQRNATSRKDYEDAEAAWKSASNFVDQARQDVIRAELAIRIAQEQVDSLTVRAPFAGTVTKLTAHVGDTVLARADSVRESQSLLTLTDMNSMVIDADVAETNTSMLRPGLPGEAVLDGFPDQPFKIELQRVAPVASVEKGTVGIRLSLLNPPAGIRPNMAARIRISVPKPQTQSQPYVGEAQP
ncbi:MULTISPECIES: efflux RND transporter periplasmic adaptor subunit [unclassified Agrobacterium]|uniref:efflux RND transporter periplasmic adaptor subunit n=1 Tax=unclassified Agrobacterium TaxID=2632611 RepID=UPI00083D0521|nr:MULTISPECIES: efflux RND transporter periplasmic adaptor subunit [unclassified Agrobacterium]AOG12684.1 efflux transporter, RND family, MFP subunit [Agrobacterium sp. RAC06]QGG93420.1 efflux RND transporter periplasmic adaptor subunit [Agrobacterium sp. MA01]